MRTFFALTLAASVALAAAQTTSIKDMLDDIAKNKQRIQTVQTSLKSVTFMSDLDANLKKQAKTITATQEKQAAGIKSALSDIASIKSTVDGTIKDLKADVAKQLEAGDKKIDASVKKSQAAAAAAKKLADAAATKQATDLKKAVDDQLKSVKSLPEDFKKASLRFMHKSFQLLDWMASPSNARGAGRIFYKVNYNPGSPGHFQPDRRELHTACRDLSAFLKARDGVDRGLKPACDNPSHCGSQGVSLPNSYLSHYGCNSNYRVEDRGYGMPLTFVSGVMMYNRKDSWHGAHMLVNRGNNCDHFWTQYHDHTTNKGRSMLCTGSNSNFKKAPQ